MRKYQGRSKEDLKGYEVAPLNAGIHTEGSKANQCKPEVTQKPKEKSKKKTQEKGKGTPEDITGTPSA